jgi:hypothetical protein
MRVMARSSMWGIVAMVVTSSMVQRPAVAADADARKTNAAKAVESLRQDLILLLDQ